MIKRISKYQQGGTTASKEEQLVQLFQMAAQNAQVDPEALVKKAQELGEDENATAQFMQGLQLCAQGDPEGIKFIQSLFKPAYKQGGKIHDFVCKHSKGGRTANCGCNKAQEGLALPNYHRVGELTQQDAGWQNKTNIIASLHNIFGQDITEPTKEGAWRMGGLEPHAGYNSSGEKVYSPTAWENIKDFYERVLPESNRVTGPRETLAGLECGGKVKKAQGGSDGMPQARNAKAARRAASKNTVSVGNSGRAKNRKIGAATDKFGGQHLYEDSVIDGSWSDVYVDVPHPGDTIVTQSFPVAGGNDTATRTYPMGSEPYESIMSRMRPAFRMFFPQYKCGGNIKKKESSKVIKGQNGFLNLWQSAYDSKFGKGLRNFMFGTDSDLSDEEYIKKHGYSKPIAGMPPAVKISYIPEGVYGSTRMAEQVAKAAKEAAKFKHVSPLDGGRLGHTIKDVSGIHLKNNGGKVGKAQDGSIIDYYKDKWSNDLNRIKQGWSRFKESAPGKVLGAFMPNPNSETGMLGAAAPIGKINPAELERATANAAGWGAVSDAIAEILPGWAMAGAAAVAKDEIDKKNKK